MRVFILIKLFIFTSIAVFAQLEKPFQRVDGYKGIWFELGQKSTYGDKYSGGLGTYTAKHRPLAIYDSISNKTFFVYGGTTASDQKHLLCMISFYDHEKKQVPKPVVVFDKQGVDDPHDNPSLLIDPEGYIWVFVSGRGRRRMGYKYRSTQPRSIDSFIQVSEEEMTYPQPFFVPGQGYLHFFTKYTGMRELYFETSKNGSDWTEDQKLAGIKRAGDQRAGHYQMSDRFGQKLVTFFNWHPDGNVDRRTNLYYLQSTDLGKSWQTIDQKNVQTPLTEVANPALVVEYFSKGKNVYLKDVNFDRNGNPIALVVVSNGHQPGPDNGLRHWQIAHWDGFTWQIRKVCTSDHNYDMGSIYVEDNYWWVVAPTVSNPQPWGTGGEMMIWESSDQGRNWDQVLQITQGSERNHAYLRRPFNTHPDFYGFWADGNPDRFSISKLYFMNKAGKVFELPYEMKEAFYQFE